MSHILRLLGAVVASATALPALAAAPQTPAEVVAQAPASEWTSIPASDLLVMDLAPDATGMPRRVVIQLMPLPYAPRHIANIRALALAQWWDGTSINRVQDDYVVQWGDATEKKPLPQGLANVPESDYVTSAAAIAAAGGVHAPSPGAADIVATATAAAPLGWHQRDSYAAWADIDRGWPIAGEGDARWPAHCYGMVGVGRDLSPDTGTGAELYVVIGQAPRQLDRNIAIVGRIVAGIEHLSSLPRGTGALGFYKTAVERVPIRSVRLASTLPDAERPRFESLSSTGPSFARYVALRANRKDAFYGRPAGAVDLCNIVPPVRPVAAGGH